MRQFRNAVYVVETMMSELGWNLDRSITTNWVSYKLGRKVVLDLFWVRTSEWQLSFKLPPGVADGFKGSHWVYARYYPHHREAAFRPLQPETPDVGELKRFFVAAREYVANRD